MPIVDAYGERKAQQVQRDTWGHLDATPNLAYPGSIWFAEGEFGGERFILRSEFGAAGYGPWFYEGIHDWLWEQDVTPGEVYRFTGIYRRTHHGHEFTGQVDRVEMGSGPINHAKANES